MTIYAVNGKEPVAAWIPSLDTAGNGTTTLTDLVGSNNGTLTNMDAATDWVADTNNGGVRALDFDGRNQHVNCGTSSNIIAAGSVSVSLWCYLRTKSTGDRIFSNYSGSGSAADGLVLISLLDDPTVGGTNYVWRASVKISGTQHNVFASSASTGVWSHVVMTHDGSTLKIYVNNTLESSLAVSGTLPTSANLLGLAEEPPIGGAAEGLDGRLDDIRVWSGTAIDASDVSYLYNSGNGRGRVVDPAPTGVTYHPLSSRSTHPLRFSI